MNAVQIIDGLPYPSFFPKEKYYLMKNLRPRKNDIILSAFPKCGTHWVDYITWSILHPDEPAPQGNRVSADIPLVDYSGLSVWEDSPEDQGRTLSTHLPADRLHMNGNGKYIATMRNPLDCCVSFYYFWTSLSQVQETAKDDPEHFEKEFTLDVFFDQFLKGENTYGDFFKHVKSWYELRNQENVHLLVFEKMKANPREEILKLAKFLGNGEKLEANNGILLDKIVKQSSFTVMKKNLQYNDGQAKLNMLRKGTVGSYRDTLSPQQIESLKSKMETELAGTEILEIWRNA